MADREILTKGAFAERAGVSAGRVSQWISEGKIPAIALVGEGVRARIDVALAMTSLNRSLDISQRLGNGIATRIDAKLPPADDAVDQPASMGGAAEAPGSTDRPMSVEDQLKQEKLWEARARNKRLAEEDRERAGLYVRTDAVRAAEARQAQAIMTAIEQGLSSIAERIAAEHELPLRDVTHLINQEFREVRKKAAARLRVEAAEMPELVEDPHVEVVA